MRYLRLNLRLLRRSLLYWIFLVLSAAAAAYFMFFHVKAGEYINGYFLLSGMRYLQAAWFVFAFCIAVYFAQASNAVEISCLVSKGKTRFWRFAALFVFSCCLVVLLVLFCVYSLISVEAGFRYCVRAALAIAAQYGLLLFLAQSLGFAAGCLGRSVFLYLLVVPAALVFTHLNESVLLWLTSDAVAPMAEVASPAAKLSDLFSVNVMVPHSLYTDFAGPMLDHEYWIRWGFKLLIGLAAVLSISGHWSRKPRRAAAPLRFAGCIACLGLAAVLGVVFFRLYPTAYRTDEKLQVDYRYDTYTPGYHIKAYEGSVEIGEPCAVSVMMTLESDGGGDLVFRLDEGFHPVFTCDGRTLSFNRKRDMITISADQLPQSGEFVIEAIYENRVYYISELSNLELFVTSGGLAAIPSSFALLPEIPNDTTLHNYRVTVAGGLTLASNLNIDGDLLTGQASGICLFSGFFDTVMLGDMTVIQSDGNGMIQTEQALQTMQSYGAYLDGEAKLTATNGEFSPKKLLILRYSYNTGWFPVLYADYGIGNFGLG